MPRGKVTSSIDVVQNGIAHTHDPVQIGQDPKPDGLQHQLVRTGASNVRISWRTCLNSIKSSVS